MLSRDQVDNVVFLYIPRNDCSDNERSHRISSAMAQ